MDKINCSRLPVTNNKLRKCSHTESIKYSPNSTKLPFLQQKHQHQHQEQQKHSVLETPFIACNQIHRTHSKRWQQQYNSVRKHHYQHHPHQKQPYQTKLNDLYSNSEHITSKNFSKKFSFTQHSNHLSRFYMIFVIFLIYLLDKINCDQGKN